MVSTRYAWALYTHLPNLKLTINSLDEDQQSTEWKGRTEGWSNWYLLQHMGQLFCQVNY